MPTLPLIFDTIPGLGATGPHATFPLPFLHLRERSETLALVVTFSPSLAGESRRPAKIACVVLHRFHDVSPTEQSKAKQRSTIIIIIIIIIILKNVRATIFPTGDDHFGRETKFPPVPVVAGLDAQSSYPTGLQDGPGP